MKSCAIFLCLLAGFLACAGKHSEPDPYATVAEFCEAWGQVACSPTVVSRCAGVDASGVTKDLTQACAASQQAFCEGLVPDGYVSAQAKVCLGAVSTAYSDGTLTAAEIATVRHLGDPCNHLIKGNRAAGDTCTTDNDCDTVDDYSCVMKSGVGSCAIPEVVANGTSCSAPAAACNAGFYCDGAHCVQSLDSGEKCSHDFECASGLVCDADSGKCATRVSQTKCAEDADCTSNVCDLPAARCVTAVTLSVAEGLCQDLR